MQFSFIWPIDKPLSGATTSRQSEGELCILQSSSITGTSPSDCLVSYLEHSEGLLSLCRGGVGLFNSLSWLGNIVSEQPAPNITNK